MKYFTLDWWGNWSETNDRDICNEYQVYYDSIKDQLPSDLRRLHEEVSLHDGNLVKLSSDFQKKKVDLEILGYNYTLDYTSAGLRKIQLLYQGVSGLVSISDPQKGLPGPHGYGDIGYDEVEMISSGCFEHRIIFSSGIEIRIEFNSFKLEYLDIVD